MNISNSTTLTMSISNSSKSPEDRTVTKAILVTVYILIFIVGVCGNLLVCFHFSFESRKLKHVQLFIFYLAVFDLLASIFNPFVFVYHELTDYKMWHFDTIGCKILPNLWKIFTTISYGIIMLINLDRCIAIHRPFRHGVKKSTVNKIIAGITVASILLDIPDIYHMTYDKQRGICRVPFVGNPNYGLPNVIIHLVLCISYLTIFIFTFIVIHKELQMKRGSSAAVDLHKVAENKAVLKMLIFVATIFVIFTYPREILHITYTLSWLNKEETDKTGIGRTEIIVVNSYITALVSCNCFINVFIYAKVHKRFRVALKTRVSSVLSISIKENNTNRENIQTNDVLLNNHDSGH